MDTLLSRISDWFLKKEDWLRIFARHDSRVEGWFKGEMLVCLEQLRNGEHIDEFEREFTVGAKGWGVQGQLKIDFRIRRGGQDQLCELKAMCISQAYGTGRDLDFYFRPKENKGLTKDFLKLATLASGQPLWILSFLYPAPSRQDWDLALRKWEKVISPWRCLTTPASYPDWFFLGCWKLDRTKNPGP